MQDSYAYDSTAAKLVDSVDDDARVVMQFGAGPAGVGPAVGFDSGEFFPGPPSESEIPGADSSPA